MDHTRPGTGTVALVGREAEMAVMVNLFDATLAAAETRVLFVSGEAGIGKSRLLAEFQQVLARERAVSGALVGSGQVAVSSLAAEPYSGLRECLRSLSVNAGRLEESLGSRVLQTLLRTAPDWMAAVPVVGDLLAAGVKTATEFSHVGPAGTLSSRSPLDQIVDFVEGVSAEHPLVLMVDDLQWADSSTLDILTATALRVHRPLLLVCSFRGQGRASVSGEVAPTLTRLTARLERHLGDSCVSVPLRPLSHEDLEAVARSVRRHHPLRTRELKDIVSRSGGNPLFAQSLAQLPGSTLTVASPHAKQLRIKAVLDERISLLSRAQVTLLETAAVIGSVFEVDHLSDLLRMTEDDVLDVLDGLFDLGGLIEPNVPRGSHERYSFHHPLLFELMRERARENGPRWRRANARILAVYQAEAGSRRGWEDESLLRAVASALESGAADETHALSMLAAARQVRLGAVTEATEFAELAVRTAPTALDRYRASDLLARSLTEAGAHRRCIETCDAIEAPDGIPAVERLGRDLVHARSVRMTNDWRRLSTILEALEAAATTVGAREVHAEVLMLRAEAHLCSDAQDLVACASVVDQVLSSTADGPLAARALGHRGLAALAEGDVGGSWEWLTASLDQAQATGRPYVLYEALFWQAKWALAVLDLVRAEELLGRLADISDRYGVAGTSPFHHRDLARVLALQGHPGAAAEHLAHYLVTVPDRALDFALFHLILQVREVEQTVRREVADDLVAGVEAYLDDDLPTHRATQVRRATRALSERAEQWDDRMLARYIVGLSGEAMEAAARNFRFYVRDLPGVRAGARDWLARELTPPHGS